MNNCGVCGNRVEGQYCSVCGQAQVCASCGNHFDGAEKFCSKCGTARETVQQTSQPEEVRDPVQGSGQSQDWTGQAGNQSPESNQYSGNPTQNPGGYQQEPQGFSPNVQQGQGGYQPNINQGNAPGGPGNQYYSPQKKSNKGLIWGISIGAVVIAAAIVCYFVFFKAPSSPSAVVEAFIDALEDRDMDKAREYLLEGDFEYFDDFAYAFEIIPSSADLKFSVDIVGEYIDGNEAEVDAVMEMEASFMGESFSESDEVTFYLTKQGGKWKITEESFY